MDEASPFWQPARSIRPIGQMQTRTHTPSPSIIVFRMASCGLKRRPNATSPNLPQQSPMPIRLLSPADAPGYLTLRREMLRDSPWAFASSPEDDRFGTIDDIADYLSKPRQAIVAALDDVHTLLGAAGILANQRRKMAHRAYIWGVYITPHARGRGLGDAILRHALGLAATWPGVNSVSLSASQRSTHAIALYTSLGFTTWGIEPGCTIIDGQPFDEVHMLATLPRPAPPSPSPGSPDPTPAGSQG